MALISIAVCPNPVFIIGCQRSGTTILANALDLHSELFNLNETMFMLELFGKGRAEEAYQTTYDRPAITMLRKHHVNRQKFLEALGLGVNALFTEKSNGKRWIDKSPKHTLMLDLLAGMFPGASFLHILRDGRRVVHSMRNFHNAPSREKERQKVGPMKQWDFTNACREWSRYVNTAMAFSNAHSSRCLTVVNEQMIENPDREFRKIFEFLQLAYEASPVDFFANNQINSSFWPKGRVEGALSDRFTDPWREWNTEEKRVFMEEAGESLVRWGLAAEQELHV